MITTTETLKTVNNINLRTVMVMVTARENVLRPGRGRLYMGARKGGAPTENLPPPPGGPAYLMFCLHNAL